jgi:hydroxymethylbilane synthase
MSPRLKLGTRRSLLAWTQSSWVASELERLNPGLKVELVGIETRGDQIQNVPLSSIEGKEFFVAELDQALRTGAVDLCVHSLKDLSLERPLEFKLAAIPAREESRDFLFLERGVAQRLVRGEALELRIGTSSPRRIEITVPFLSVLFPSARFKAVEIRGNVNTRLSRILPQTDSAKKLDGVVLAGAGINRLMANADAAREMQPLIDASRPIALPLLECPTAPGQGALAVECRAVDRVTCDAIERLHDPLTARAIARERAVLAEWGGGCHQALGASAMSHPELPSLFSVQGVHPSGERISRLEGVPELSPHALLVSTDPKVGVMTTREDVESELKKALNAVTRAKTLWLSHSAALPKGSALEALVRERTEKGELRVIAAGLISWKKLIARGIFVTACAEGLGVDEFAGPRGLARSSRALGLGTQADWALLTHEDAGGTHHSLGFSIFTPYRVRLSLAPGAERIIGGAKELYWSSFSLFQAFAHLCGKDAQHYCGPGKTASRMREVGVNPKVVIK